jgi:hypothetical protein
MAFDPKRTAFVKGEWGAEIVDALSPQEDDVVVEGKRGLDTRSTRTRSSSTTRCSPT